MIYKLIDDIRSYTKLLEDIGMRVTLHTKTKALENYACLLSELNIHSSPYCLYVKSNDAAWNKCISCQYRIYERAKPFEPFFGMCHAGVEELVFPIGEHEVFAFISVSGYGIDIEKAKTRMRRLSAEFGLSHSTLRGLYDENLIHETPPTERLRGFIAPLAHMFMAFFKSVEELDAQRLIQTNNKDFTVNSIMIYIRRHFSERITLEALSNEFGCSCSSISHMFKKRTGLSISAYINKVRIETAAGLLQNSTFSVTDISETVGFSDVSYFIRCFREEYDESPASWRKGLAK